MTYDRPVMMGKTIAFLAATFFLPSPGIRAEVALVYQNSDAVLKGRSSLGSVTPDGILISAEEALKANTKPLLGLPGQKLRQGVLVRLDNDMNAALFRLGEEVSSPDLQAAHEKKAAALQAFLPSSPEGSASLPSALPVVTSTEPFLVKIHGQPVDSGPLVLSLKGKESKARLEIIRNGSDPVWRIAVKLESTPKMFFWKRGKQRTMTDVPGPKFRYEEQLLFKPMTAGSSVEVGLELSSIKEESYLWTLKVESKKGSTLRRIPVKFEKAL